MEIKILKVKIVRCGGNIYWYKNRIGEVFEVYDKKYQDYEVVSNDILYIQKEDCEIIKEVGSEDIAPRYLEEESFEKEQTQIIKDDAKEVEVYPQDYIKALGLACELHMEHINNLNTTLARSHNIVQSQSRNIELHMTKNKALQETIKKQENLLDELSAKVVKLKKELSREKKIVDAVINW